MYTFLIFLAVVLVAGRILMAPAKRAAVVQRTVADAMPRAGVRRSGEYAWSSVNVDAKRGAL